MMQRKKNLLPKQYVYKQKSRMAPRMNLDRLHTFTEQADETPLTGYINGEKASDIEERVARALRLAKATFRFQVPFQTVTSLPGQKSLVDFVIQVGGFNYPLEVDGRIGHMTSTQQGKDAAREMVLNARFRELGLMPLSRLKWWQLGTQAQANAAVRQLFRM
jgi:hypothetical protein